MRAQRPLRSTFAPDAYAYGLEDPPGMRPRVVLITRHLLVASEKRHLELEVPEPNSTQVGAPRHCVVPKAHQSARQSFQLRLGGAQLDHRSQMGTQYLSVWC